MFTTASRDGYKSKEIRGNLQNYFIDIKFQLDYPLVEMIMFLDLERKVNESICP